MIDNADDRRSKNLCYTITSLLSLQVKLDQLEERSRREVGHGNLALRALKTMLPKKTDSLTQFD